MMQTQTDSCLLRRKRTRNGKQTAENSEKNSFPFSSLWFEVEILRKSFYLTRKKLVCHVSSRETVGVSGCLAVRRGCGAAFRVHDVLVPTDLDGFSKRLHTPDV